jgi:cytochrome P450
MDWLLELGPGWHLQNRLWVATEHAECRAILADHQRFLQWDGEPLLGMTAPPAGQITVQLPLSRRQPLSDIGPYCFAQTAVFLDGPEHGRFRRLLTKSWQTAAAAEGARLQAAELADRLISAAVSGGPFDFMADIAVPISAHTIATFFGDDPQPWVELSRHHPAIWGNDDPATADRLVAELQVRAWNLIAERRANPRDDAFSRMAAGVGDARLTDAEIATVALQGGFASNDGTILLLGGVAESIAGNLAVQSSLRDGHLSVSRLVTEVLAQLPPLRGIFRRTETSFDWNGTVLPADTGVFVSIAAANSTLSGANSRSTPRHHLSYGSGVHVCPGAQVVTMLGEVVAEALTAHGPVRLADPHPSRQWNGMFYGPRQLWIEATE